MDVATEPEGGPLLQELKVIGLRLFLGSTPSSVGRLADAIPREARAVTLASGFELVPQLPTAASRPRA